MATLYQAMVYITLLIQMCTSNTHNIKACLTNHDQWLYPGIKQGIELITRQVIPYEDE